MSDEIPQPFDSSSMTPELAQELQASFMAEDFYDLAYGIPNGMQRLTMALMRTSGNGRLAAYAEKLAPAYQVAGEDQVRAVELGWSVGYMYHHQLALIRLGRVPVIGLPAMVQWQDEDKTDTGLMSYMRTNLPA